MNIRTETVKKLVVTNITGLDPLSIYLEDYGLGRGKLVITCDGESWTRYWGAMGENCALVDFIIGCDNSYLAKKLSTVPSMIDNPDLLISDMKKKIIEARKCDDFNSKDARKYFDEVEDYEDRPDEMMGNHDLLYAIYGDEWWCCLPKEPNPQYEYLCRIINAVKEALSIDKVTQVTV